MLPLWQAGSMIKTYNLFAGGVFLCRYNSDRVNTYLPDKKNMVKFLIIGDYC